MADLDEVALMLKDLAIKIRDLTAKVEELRREMRNGFDRLAARAETGSRWTNRMNKCFESADRTLAMWDERNERLEQRLRKLESGGS